MVRAKVTLISSKQHMYNPEARELEFNCVYDDGIPENKRFYDATPSGHFTMLVNNPKVIRQLELGESYYLDLTPAE